MTAPTLLPADIARLAPAFQLAVERELCVRSLYEFAKRVWHVLEPGRKFKDNWHIHGICDHLQAVSEGHIKRLIINVPPRHMKSLLVSVIWPVWDWLRTPTRQFLTASYKQPLATRDALKSRQIIQSPWFQARFGHMFKLGKDQNEKQRYQNDKMGHRIAISASGGVGEGGDFLIADAPQNTDEMGSPAYIESTSDWWNNTFNQRLNDQNDGAIVLTMQRLSENDICSLAIGEGGWEHLMLPAEYEIARHCSTSIGFDDPRTAEGELLWPNRIGREQLDKMKFRLGSYGTAGQLQQRPAPKGGGLFKRNWYPTIKRKDLPPFFHYHISWDTASTEDKKNDQSGCTVWGLSAEPGKKGFFKLGQYADWLEIPELIVKVDEFRRNPAWLGAQLLIENKNSGPAVIQHLQRKGIAVTPIEPKGSKEDRAKRILPLVEGGMVWLVQEDQDENPAQHLIDKNENEVFLSQSDVFPNGKLRDIFDSAVQAIDYGISTYTFEAAGYDYIGSSSAQAAPSNDDEDDEEWH